MFEDRGHQRPSWPSPTAREVMLARVVARGRHLRRRRHRIMFGTVAVGVVAMCGVAAALVLGRGPAPSRVVVAAPPDATVPHGSSPTRNLDQVYRWTGTVLAGDGHGPEMCVGGVAEASPPRCSGVALAAFDWSKVPADAQHRHGTVRWSASLTLFGTYDGSTFRLVRPPEVAEPKHTSRRASPQRSAAGIDLPCDPPPGGWRVTDPSKTSLSDYQAYERYVTSQPDLSFAWQDSTASVAGYTGDPLSEWLPQAAVQIAAFTGDLAEHRAAIAARWGGPVCVVRRSPTKRAFSAFEARLHQPDVAPAGVEVVSTTLVSSGGRPKLHVTVLIDDGVTKAWFAAHRGNVPVWITAAFQPVG